MYKILTFLEKLWVWSEKEWAKFSNVYKETVKAINEKLDINTRVEEITISSMTVYNTEWKTYGIWTPYMNTDWYEFISDWVLTVEEGLELKASKKKMYWHALAWDASDGWWLFDNFWNKISCPLWTLKQLAKAGIVWNMARWIIPADDETATILHYTKRMAESELLWRLDFYFETNKNEWWFPKAKTLFTYWR